MMLVLFAGYGTGASGTKASWRFQDVCMMPGFRHTDQPKAADRLTVVDVQHSMLLKLLEPRAMSIFRLYLCMPSHQRQHLFNGRPSSAGYGLSKAAWG